MAAGLKLTYTAIDFHFHCEGMQRIALSLSLSTRGDLQWNAGEKKLTGGANWQPKVAPATWSTGGVPSGPLVGA